MSDRAHILDALRDLESTGCERPEIPPNTDLFTVPDGDLADVFQRQLEALSGEVFRVDNVDSAKSVLAHVVGDGNARFDGSESLRTIVEDLPAVGAETNEELAAIECGVTGATALLARTGSVVLSSNHGGRRLSALPPTHVVIAWARQLVPTLSDLPLVPTDASVLTVVSGPSRTADIEKILVLGAHGPKRLVVILIDSE